MSNNNLPPEHAVQQSGKRSRVPLIIAGVLALLLLAGALVLLFIGVSKDRVAEGVAQAGTGGAVGGEYGVIAHDGPAGMISGGAVFGSGMKPFETPGLVAGEAPRPHVVDRDAGAVDILVYVDYRCPHCMAFETTNALVLEEALAAGATVEVRPLTFMDKYSAGSQYSSRAANLFACTVEFEPDSAWLMNGLLLNPNVQPAGEGPGHDDAALLELATNLTGSSDPDYAACITENWYVPFFGAMNEWTFQHPVPGSVGSSLMVSGTPLVVVNGIEFTGDVSSSADFRSFLVEQGLFG